MPMPGGYRRTPKIPPAAKEAAQEAVENRSRIHVGSRVTIVWEGESDSETYTVVPPDAVDARQHRLSLNAPLMIALADVEEGGVASYEVSGQGYRIRLIKIE